jgi:hypothetical protein
VFAIVLRVVFASRARAIGYFAFGVVNNFVSGSRVALAGILYGFVPSNGRKRT